MKLKEKWLIFLIIALAIIGIIVAVKLLPIYVTSIAVFSLIFGGISGWYLRGLYNKYFPKV